MKKVIAAALISVLAASPAFADTAPSRAATMKPAAGKTMKNKQDKCNFRHDMSHYGYGMGGYGHGMTGGGYGMMGMSSGMMSPNTHLLGALNLSDAQQAKVNKLSDELRHNNWTTQGQFNDETAKLRDLYEADHRDPVAIDKEYQKIFDLKRQMIKAYLETENSIEDVLTPEQRTQLKEARHKMRHMYGY